MALFEVEGWTVPSNVQPAPAATSRKRKRPGTGEFGDKLQTAELNLEKLMKKMGNEAGGPLAEEKGRKGTDGERSGRRKDRKKALGLKDTGGLESQERPGAPPSHRKRDKPKKSLKGSKEVSISSHHANAGALEVSPRKHARPQNEGPTRKNVEKGRKKEGREANAHSQEKMESLQTDASHTQLTSLQARMKQSLDGARFRWINETLYKSGSKDAVSLMHEDPKVFEEYHAGFRHQVTSWPINPVGHFVQTLSSCPERTVIVDLGCGDAALACDLIPKGFTVLSYDIVAANPFIVAADICDKVPLPGAEIGDEGQIVDVVVCSLSLMSTNWLNCIREARRVLKLGGAFKIAEVASRFTDVNKFTSVISSVGFHLVSKDESNSHFTLFDFKKTERVRILDDKAWQKLMARGDVLQPCEYKRR
ncbi:methyltransferase-domain-containing protein [Phellopilus nigrolimitatus]|nr:methyltransferase-domain-containing protein [Phellopilus nigrolimitatus]